MLDAARDLLAEVLIRRVEHNPIISTLSSLTDYLHATMGHLPVEQARILHLNTKNVLLRDEVVGEGSLNQVAVYVREVVKRALEIGSAAIILAHNHPSGDPAPSNEDMRITRELRNGLRTVGIVLHDHIIVASTGNHSFRQAGTL